MKHSSGASHAQVQRKICSIVSSAALRLALEIGLAVERVLADVEVERRQVRVHELRQHRDHALVVVVGVGLAHDLVELDQPMQHQPLQLRHGSAAACCCLLSWCASVPSIQRSVFLSLR